MKQKPNVYSGGADFPYGGINAWVSSREFELGVRTRSLKWSTWSARVPGDRAVLSVISHECTFKLKEVLKLLLLLLLYKTVKTKPNHELCKLNYITVERHKVMAKIQECSCSTKRCLATKPGFSVTLNNKLIPDTGLKKPKTGSLITYRCRVVPR
jgi:hypothetical protein